MMLVCGDCGASFDETEARYVGTSCEDYYGVAGLFPNSTPMTLAVCPICGSDNVSECDKDGIECEDCEEWEECPNFKQPDEYCELCEETDDSACDYCRKFEKYEKRMAKREGDGE